MKTISRELLLIALGMTILSSCTLLEPANVETRKEMLTKVPLDLPPGKTHAATLLVLPPETSAVYDTTQMAYEIRPHEIAYFGRTEWGEKPSQMIHRLVVQTIENAHCVATVVTPPFTGPYTHSLRTEILALQQDFTSQPATLQLTLRVQLTSVAANQVIGTKEISVREPMQERTPYAGAVAANDATAKALAQLAEFVRVNTS
jgi:cholesterol transport system auxiliary component